MRRAKRDISASARRRGFALPYIALIGIVLLGILGLAVDWGYVVVSANQLQNAADAASLAAAGKLGEMIANPGSGVPSDAIAKAVEVAAANRAAGASVQLDPDVDVILGSCPSHGSAFTPGGVDRWGNYNAVHVIARRTTGSLGGAVPLFFGRMFNVDTADVQRQAVARILGYIAGGMVVLNHENIEGALYFDGGATITVENGGVVVNSDKNNPEPVSPPGSGSWVLDAPDLYLVSGEQVPAGHFTGEQTRISEPVPDPFANRPGIPPSDYKDPGKYPVRTYPANTIDIEPGYYPNGLPSTNKLPLHLSPGIYVIDSIKGLNENMIGDGVMLYLAQGTINLGGNKSVSLAPLNLPAGDANAVYNGMTIFQARSNTTSCTYIGNPSDQLKGAIYLPFAHLEIRGDAENFGNQLVVDTMTVRGNVSVNIDYNGDNPSYSTKPFLVR